MDTSLEVFENLRSSLRVLGDSLDSVADDFNEQIGHLRVCIAELESELPNE